jgi:AcrR family transcriptional regulator
MRPRRQDERRRQLIEAARRVLLERGAVGLRVKDVAVRIGLAPSTVLYYYPEIADLLLEVGSAAMSRYAERRAEAVRSIASPVGRLRLAIHLGVPSGPDDEESRLLYEIDALTGTSHAFDVLSASFFDRQVSLYEGILEAGVAAADFELSAPAPRLAASRGHGVRGIPATRRPRPRSRLPAYYRRSRRVSNRPLRMGSISPRIRTPTRRHPRRVGHQRCSSAGR